MLDIRDLTLQYRNAPPVFRDLSFTLSKGITVLIGPNGAGKSSLLHAILGRIPFTGKILLEGTPLSQISFSERAKRISLLPQSLPAPALSVREVVALGFSPYCTRLSEKEWQTVREILQKVELDALADRAVNTLSGGERQRVFLAMMLAQNTPVLLLDEPATYMDARVSALLHRLLREERAKGKHILLVMHDLTDALALADRVLVLNEGTLAFDGTPTECLAAEVPERIFALKRFRAVDETGVSRIFFRP